jgi:hypothetical protein
VVLDDGHGSKRASNGSDLSPISRVGGWHFQGVSGPRTRRVAAAASPQVRQPLQFPQKSSEARDHRSPRVLVFAAKIRANAPPIYRVF